MKKNTFSCIIFLCIAFLCISCFDDLDLYNPETVKKYKLTESIEAQINENYISIATFNGDTIFVGNVSTMVDVPRINTSHTRNVYEGLEWHFIPNESNNWFYQKIFKGVALFEDVPNGDCDYNDFVCKIGYQIDVDVDYNGYVNINNSNGLKVSITGIYPLAMGNTLPIGFGFEIVNLKDNSYLIDKIIYEDIRRDAFDNVQGFINTTEPNFDPQNRNYSADYSVVFPKKLDKNGFAVNFYIKCGDKKHYMVDSSRADLTQNYTPWGLFIPISDAIYYNPSEIGFRYPKEMKSIFDTYPCFSGWVNGENTNPFAEVIEENLY